MAIIFDIETYCDLDLEEVGVIRYTRHPSFKIILNSWLNTNDPEIIHTWHYGEPTPKEFYDNSESYYAFNAQFEYECLLMDGYWLSILKDRYIDVMALCARYGFPQKLEQAAKVLCPNEAKDSAGKTLIKKFCGPNKPAPYKGPDWEAFVQYNRQDVRSTYALLKALPCNKLNDSETAIFQLNWLINKRGLPMDMQSAQQIYNITEEYLSHAGERLSELTDGAVTTPKQIKRIVTWLDSKGVHLDNLQAQTVQAALETDLPEEARQVLELRAAASMSSIRKYKRILGMSYCNRMYYNSRYHGAHTGRITGMGFQMLNLPRAKVENPEEVIEEFFQKDKPVENPIFKARALIRPMIKAPKGKKFLCADYSSIEYIMLVWLAGDKEAVKLFNEGQDQYKLLAMHMYHKGYDEINKQERQMGKVGILGCGYGMGAKRCQEYAKDFGMELSFHDANFIVDSFRNKYPLVRILWSKLARCALNAASSNTPYSYNNCTFRRVVHRGNKMLKLTLPSGRNLYYHKPRVKEGTYGPVVEVWGMNQVTHQWAPKELTPGKWTENVIQAIARDVLYNGKMAIEKAGYPIIGSIYDEVLCEVPDTEDYTLERLCELMCSPLDWAPDLPLKAAGWEGYRYKKD